jgi:hypothetical protein
MRCLHCHGDGFMSDSNGHKERCFYCQHSKNGHGQQVRLISWKIDFKSQQTKGLVFFCCCRWTLVLISRQASYLFLVMKLNCKSQSSKPKIRLEHSIISFYSILFIQMNGVWK